MDEKRALLTCGVSFDSPEHGVMPQPDRFP